MGKNMIKSVGRRRSLWPAALLLATGAAAQGPPPNWAVDPSGYQFSMSVVGRLKVNGVADHAAGNILAAFAGNQLRGVARPVGPPGDAYYFLTVHADAYAGEALQLKAYHAASGLVLDAVEGLAFAHNHVAGSIGAPFPVNACTPGPEEDCGRTGLAGVDDDCDGAVDEDISPPAARCRPTGIAIGPLGTAAVPSAAVNDASSDACSPAAALALAAAPASFTCADAGLRTVTLTVTDPAGNTASCSAAVTVIDALNHAQEARRTAADGLAGDNLGWGIAIGPGALIAGAPEDKVGTQSRQGSAYVFAQDQGGPDNWGQLRQLRAAGGAAVDYFGNAAALDGGTALVAAHGDNVGAATDAGSVCVFERDLGGANNWGQRASIVARLGTAAEPAAYDYFGNAVSLRAGRAVVGAARKAVAGQAARGAAYIYERDADGPGAWGNVKKLTAADGAANNLFGQAVAQAGDAVIVGAGGNLGNRGAAYVFARDNGGPANWGQAQKLAAPDAAVGDGFGTAVAMTPAHAIVGAPNKAAYAGAAYVFGQSAGTWAQPRKLAADDAAPNDRFGAAVAIAGEYAYVAAPRANSGTGAVYVFHRDAGGAGNWGQIARHTPAPGAQGDQFGGALAVAGNRMAVGAGLADVAGRADQGAAFVFRGDACPPGPLPTGTSDGGATAAAAGPAGPQRLLCSPNPFRDELAVEVPAASGGGGWEVQLLDAVGRVVARAGLPPGQSRAELGTAGLPPGAYLVRAASERGAAAAAAVLLR